MRAPRRLDKTFNSIENMIETHSDIDIPDNLSEVGEVIGEVIGDAIEGILEFLGGIFG